MPVPTLILANMPVADETVIVSLLTAPDTVADARLIVAALV